MSDLGWIVLVGWIILAAIGWIAAIWYRYLAKRWRKAALEEAILAGRYAAKLTESIRLTDAALAVNASLMEPANEVMPSATDQRPN